MKKPHRCHPLKPHRVILWLDQGIHSKTTPRHPLNPTASSSAPHPVILWLDQGIHNPHRVILWLDQGIRSKGRKAWLSTNDRIEEEDGSPDQVGG